MPGLSRLLVLLLLPAALAAQGLPDVGRLEVENARLVLLDADGRRLGVLEGEKARKGADGVVVITAARLLVTRGKQSFALVCPDFRYNPGAGTFEIPAGATVELPDGGRVDAPPGKGEITYGEKVNLKLDCTGAATLRTGTEAEPLLQATVTDPVVTANLVPPQQGEGLVLKLLSITGARGGELGVRLSSVPSAEPGDAAPGVVRASCFGDVRLELTENGERALLLLQRRARMGSDSTHQPLELTCNQMTLRGRVLRGDKGVMLGEQVLEADGNVALTARRLKGNGGQFVFRQQETAHELTLRDGASLDLDQSSKTRPAKLRMLARESIRAVVPHAPAGKGVQRVDLELLASARIWREAAGVEEWRVVGRRVAVQTTRDDPDREEFSHAFEAESEGYSPLLQVTGAAAPELVQGAAVYGRSASGTFSQGTLKATALGPELLAVVSSPSPLASRLRAVLAPSRKDDNKPAGAASRLVMRATATLDIEVQAEAPQDTEQQKTPRFLKLAADGDVTAEHESLPRNDAELVVLSGKSVALELQELLQGLKREYELRLLDIQPGANGARMTVGYDLLSAQSVHIEGGQRRYKGSIAGPGRMIARTSDTLAGLQQAVQRLPRPLEQTGAQPKPDGAWLTFNTSMSLESDDDRYGLEARDCTMRLVRGDFEQPRAGLAGFADVAELEAADVARLYEADGERLQIISTGHAAGAAAVVHVLRLAGNASLRSVADGFSATAREAIEVSGADSQSNPDAPLSVVLLGEAQVELAQAGPFFGEAVRGGTFGYDGRWQMTALDRLEFTVTPLPEQTPGAVTLARNLAADAMNAELPAWFAALQAERGVRACMLAGSAAEETLQAGQELASAARLLRVAAALAAVGDTMAAHWRARGQAAARRAKALLGGRMEVVALGGVHASLQAVRDAVPAIAFAANSLTVVFNGLGSVVDAAADGPVEVARAGYSLRGSGIRRAQDGTLTLADAGITLPADTGVEVTGVKQISLKQTEAATGNGQPERTMVTRVTGKKLGVRVRVSHSTGR